MDAPARPARPPRERLASVNDPKGPRFGARRTARTAKKSVCPDCKSTDIRDLDGTSVCGDCGATLNDSNIVSEVTFGESSAGAAVVQGGFVGEGSRHAKTMGPAFRRAGGGMESREVTENYGRDEIRRQANTLNLSDHIADQAFSIYKLAANANFIQGRRINTVAATCLYVACRRDKNNQSLLMDFSEIISVNVYRLGQTYQDLKKTLVLPDNDPLGIRPLIDVENLIHKFARKLEFGNSLNKVATDAAKIMRRMKRDWMVTGRRPAGLCGACIILAARMNNFRRTVREVVYVVKVADVTVAKRLEEFKRTDAADLTVEQFKEFGVRLRRQHDPPAVYEARLREERRLGREASIATADEVEAQANGASSSSNAVRRDSDGFAIPAIPGDASSNEASNTTATEETTEETTEEPAEPAKKRRKYNKKPKPAKPPRNAPPEISPTDLIIEAELEDEMEDILADPGAYLTPEDPEFIASQTRARTLADTLRAPDPSSTPTAPVSNDPEIGEDEFESDPEVRHCLLSEAERKIKERIWVTHNEDWLRAQQAKMLKKALDEANGTTTKPKKRKKHSRMGDGSVLEGSTPVEDAADATQRMLEKRAQKFSKHINYEKLNSFYAGLRGTGSGSGKGTNVEGDGTTNTESEGAEGGAAEVEAKGKRSQSASIDPALEDGTSDSGEEAVVDGDIGLPTPAATQKKATEAGAEKEGEVGGDAVAGGEEEDEDEDEDEDDEEVAAVMEEYGEEGNYEDEDDGAGFGYEDEGEEY